jgi:cell division protein FtsQ
MTTHTETTKRSELVRQRRQRSIGRRDKRTTRSHLRTPVDTKLPPVVARNTFAHPLDAGRSKHGRAHTRRRYDIALDIPGAEVRLPALPHIRIGWRSLSGILVVLIGGLLYTLLNLPLFLVESPKIEGIQRLSAQEVNTVVNVSGRSIFEIIPGDLEKDLSEAFPEFYNVSVGISLPAQVNVKVDERQPVLAWEQNGLTVWVDENGVAFPPRGDAALDIQVEGTGVPGVEAASAGEQDIFLDPALISTIQHVGAKVPEGVKIIYDPSRGLGWKDPRGWQVYIGQNGDKMETKLQVYESIVAQLKKEQISPSMISVAQIDAPYYRLDR